MVIYKCNQSLALSEQALFRLNTNTGAATVIGNGGDAYSSAGDLAFVDGQLYLSSIYGNNLTRIDTDSGFGHNIGSIGHGNVYGLATDDHVHLYGMSGTTVLGIDIVTGAGTVLVDYGGQGLGAAWGSAFVSEVPEPGTYAMLLVGLGLLGFTTRRRKKIA